MNKFQASSVLSVTLVGSSSAGAACLWLFDASFKNLLLLAVGTLVCLLLNRTSAAIRHWIWATLLVGLVVMPVATILLPEWRVLPSWLAIENQLETPAVAVAPSSTMMGNVSDPKFEQTPVVTTESPLPASAMMSGLTPIDPVPASNWPLRVRISSSIVLTIWVGGVLALLFPIGLACIRLQRLERNSTREGSLSQRIQSQVLKVAEELNVKPPRLIVGPSGAMPMVWSFVRGRLLLPRDCDQWTDARMEAVLSHELIHLHRRDPLLFTLGLLARALNWFNPLAWYAVRRMRIECERACDDHVLRLGVDASEYASHLLEFSVGSLATRGTSSIAFAMASKPNIEQRIVSVLDEKLSRHGITYRRACALLVLMVIGVAILATLRASVANESLDQTDEDNIQIRYPYCIVEVSDLQPRSLSEAIDAFNLESKQSPTGVVQRPISASETLTAISKSLEEPNLPEPVKTVLREIEQTQTLQANAYFRRFTRFDDEQQMHGVWWVHLCIEGDAPPMYSVPIRATQLFTRPYSQMERQQKSEQGVTLINRKSSYFAKPPRIKTANELQNAAVDDLLAKVKNGLANKKLEELKALFNWEGAAFSEFAKSELQVLLTATIHSTKVEPVRLDGDLLHWSGFRTYHPNLPVVAYLEIEYSLPDDAATRKSLSLELGQSGGELRLVNYVADEPKLPEGQFAASITGHTEKLANGMFQLTTLISNPGELLSAHLANEEIWHRDLEEKRSGPQTVRATFIPRTIAETQSIEAFLKSIRSNQSYTENWRNEARRIAYVAPDVTALSNALTQFFGGKVETLGLDDLQPTAQHFGAAVQAGGKETFAGRKVALVVDRLTNTLWAFALQEDLPKIAEIAEKMGAYRDFADEELLAVVGTEKILAGDVDAFFEPTLENTRRELHGEFSVSQEKLLRATFIRDALQEYVSIKALYQEFIRDMLGKRSDQEVAEMRQKIQSKAAQIFYDKQVPVLRKRYNASDLNELETKLEERSLSLQKFKEQFIERVLASELERKYEDNSEAAEGQAQERADQRADQRERSRDLYREKILAQTAIWTLWPQDIPNSRPLPGHIADVQQVFRKNLSARPQEEQVVWGNAVDGLRLGFRSAVFAKRSTHFHHGDWLRYEVWIKNESAETIHIPRDPRNRQSPSVAENGIDLLGSGMSLSFHVPREVLDKATISIDPGQMALLDSPQAPIVSVDAAQGRFGPEPLRVAPGRYPMFAKANLSAISGNANDGASGEGKQYNLQSGRREIEVLPAARLQMREINEFTETRTREFVAQDPASHVLETTVDHFKLEVVLADSSEVLVDEEDLVAGTAIPDPINAPFYMIELALNPGVTAWLFEQTKQLNNRPLDKPLLGIFVDGKLVSASKLTPPFRDKLSITGQFTKEEAERLAGQLSGKLRPRKPVSKLLVPRKPWRIRLRLVDSGTGNPLSGIKLRIQSVLDDQRTRASEVTSDAQGLVQLDIADKETAEVEVISRGWWQASRLRFASSDMVGIPKSETTKTENSPAVDMEVQPTIDIKLNRGQPIDDPSEQRVIR
ncbi:MAG: M56 family metallopeptidase [Pirellulaceae bacterium]|nr:M56 family metallopeptidase [Pirellulaceae bacterium]